MKIKKLLFFGLAVVFSTTLSAQPPGDDDGGQKPGSAPISGIEYLIGLGGLLGVKKILDSKKKIRDHK